MIQLFQNLISNAIRHDDKAVTIHVSGEEYDDHWKMVVSDNGPGIAVKDLEKIFDPFKRMAQRKGDEPGLGLGLAISRKIVESHGGKIWCNSQLGTGTSFLFTVAKKMSISATESNFMPHMTALNQQNQNTSQTPIRILLVDDNETDIMLNQMLLIDCQKLHCEVLTACNGKEALVLLHETKQKGNPVDLVLLDINMPIMNGFELLEEMQKEQMLLETRVVMCSTSNDDIDKKMSVLLGATGYLCKPPKFSQLKDILDQGGRLQLYQEGNDYTLYRAA